MPSNDSPATRTAVFPGSFDPFTKGHESVLRRGLQLFDRIVIGVGINEQKHSGRCAEQRIAALRKLFAKEERIEVEGYADLTVDFAARHHARFILRGIRSVKDYEYELNIADLNRRLAGVETVFLFSEPEWACISSSVVKELMHFGKDITPYLPEGLEYE
ncbi:pantetheine-phosphate adenylyltransferase [Bacteroides acidifaciens]|mgnify:FL=1|uniref:pantetheine-phosphate adenylyltransferase n=1 Tax=Bacteroides acidifaciens TaxID=85831 RepID=UPI003013A129